jgi:hypothetical protein
MKKEQGKMRSDRPAGRQTMETPEHSASADPASSSLNQGQGPEFQTQDKTLKKKNPGLKKKVKDDESGSRQRPSNESQGAENREPKSGAKK